MNALLAAIDDRLNPIAVKELRQAVRSRFVLGVLSLLLGALVLAIGGTVVLGAGDLGRELSAGRDLFLVLHTVLLGGTMVFSAAYAAVRFASERQQGNVDLVFATALKPAAIVAGKFAAGAILALVVFSAAAPFLVLTYVLRGIDVVTIAVVLAVDLGAVLLAVQAGLLVGALPAHAGVKVLLGLVLLVGLALLFQLVALASGWFVYRGIGGRIGGADFWGPAAATAAVLAFGGGLLYALTVLSVSPAAANRALPVRLYVTAGWAALTAGALTAAHQLRAPMYVVTWALGAAALFGVAMLFAASERDAPNRRIRRRVPRRAWLRPFVFPFFSGSGGGVLWALGLAAATAGLAVGTLEGSFPTWSHRPSEATELYAALMALPLYGFCYALTAALLRRWVFRQRSTAITGPLALALLGFGIGGPPVVVFIDDPNGLRDLGLWLAPNPAAVAAFFDNDPEGFPREVLGVLGAWAGVVALLNLPALWRQARAFKPLPEARTRAGEAEASRG